MITVQNERLSDVTAVVEEREMHIAELNAQLASLKVEHQGQIEDMEASFKRLVFMSIVVLSNLYFLTHQL